MKYILAIVVLFPSLLRADEASDALASPHVVWSAGTNSLRLGIECSNRTLAIRLPATVLNNASFALLNESTNQVIYFFPRAMEQRWEISLVDNNGIAVAKTSKGKRFGSPLDVPPNTPQKKSPDRPEWNSPAWLGRQYRIRSRIPPRTEFRYSLGDSFDLGKAIPECFHVEKPGNYQLTVVQRLYVVDADNSKLLKSLAFPSVTVNVIVEKQ